MAEGPIAVTGSTGRLGGRVAGLLAARGVSQRLIVRNAARAPQLAKSEVYVASYQDRPALERAFAGVKTLLFVSGAESAERLQEHLTVIDAAAAAGVENFVYTSLVGAAAEATFTLARDHGATEQHLAKRGFAATLLRNNLYADFFPLMLGADDVIRGPAGEGRVAAVAREDIAEVAALVLLDPGVHRGKAYELTGPIALTLSEVAANLSKRFGRNIQFHNETLDEAYASRSQSGVEKWQVDAWVSTYMAILAGEFAHVTDDVAKLTGHPALTLDDVLAAAAEKA